MQQCGKCAHLEVCKYTDAGDGRCQQPRHYLDKSMIAIVSISAKTRKAMERIANIAHGGR